MKGLLMVPNSEYAPDPTHLIAYLAGFFDGEGCVRVMVNRAPSRRNQSPVHRLLIIVTQRYDRKEPLLLLKRHFGGTIIKHKAYKHYCSMASWQLAGKPAANALQLMLPYLTVKRYVALLGLSFFHWKEIMQVNRTWRERLSDEEIAMAESFVETFRVLNGRAIDRVVMPMIEDPDVGSGLRASEEELAQKES